MKKLIVFIVFPLIACSSISEVQPTGADTYTVSQEIGARWGTDIPYWSYVQDLPIKRANEFCGSNNKTMTAVGWEYRGVQGWSPLNAKLTFKCS